MYHDKWNTELDYYDRSLTFSINWKSLSPAGSKSEGPPQFVSIERSLHDAIEKLMSHSYLLFLSVKRFFAVFSWQPSAYLYMENIFISMILKAFKVLGSHHWRPLQTRQFLFYIRNKMYRLLRWDDYLSAKSSSTSMQHMIASRMVFALMAVVW